LTSLRSFRRALSSAVGKASIYEWRTDTLLSRRPLLPTSLALAPEPARLAAWKTEVGGPTNDVHRLYSWESFDVRDKAHIVLPNHDSDPLMSSSSMTFVEAKDALNACNLPGLSGYAPPQTSGDTLRVVWEVRKYQLRLGYGAVPKFLGIFQSGLSEKISVINEANCKSELVSLLFSDSGLLNVFMELWRHESMQHAQASREASRSAKEWRRTVNEAAELSISFDTQYMRVLPDSGWK